MITAKQCITQINKAVRQFGEHNYYDKGPQEVMDIAAVCKSMEGMTAEQIGDVLNTVKESKHGEQFVSTMLVSLQDRTDLDALYEDTRFSELF